MHGTTIRGQAYPQNYGAGSVTEMGFSPPQAAPFEW
jgi:hypothetical protein